MGSYQTISSPVPSNDLKHVLPQRYEILEYLLHIGKDEYLTLLRNAGDYDYPIPKRPQIKYESIDINILDALVDNEYVKR